MSSQPDFYSAFDFSHSAAQGLLLEFLAQGTSKDVVFQSQDCFELTELPPWLKLAPKEFGALSLDFKIDLTKLNLKIFVTSHKSGKPSTAPVLEIDYRVQLFHKLVGVKNWDVLFGDFHLAKFLVKFRDLTVFAGVGNDNLNTIHQSDLLDILSHQSLEHLKGKLFWDASSEYLGEALDEKLNPNYRQLKGLVSAITKPSSTI